MTLFTLTSKLGDQWTYEKLGALDLEKRRNMSARDTMIFAELMVEYKGTTSCSRQVDGCTYTITGMRHGGARPGAGRKPGGRNATRLDDQDRRINLGVRLPGEMVAWIRNQNQPAGRIIEAAVKMFRKGYNEETTP